MIYTDRPETHSSKWATAMALLFTQPAAAGIVIGKTQPGTQSPGLAETHRSQAGI